ncbi:hypothetical protein MX572_04685 [Rhodococcus pyridinivorans]|uniref:hypothetical protein n=1 Tax=Rhodococcus pyridinivorans TaxID=103816 RepID=UPI0020C5E50B|nr:hypothetical protein [Rhodococcus pyridinivorans]UTM38091.1 hypothetical protein MX572_04685 [Rhodococcus pyridinivorans]
MTEPVKTSPSEGRAATDVVARALTEVGAPWVINIVGSVVFGIGVGAPGWGVFVAMIAGVIPMGLILTGMRRARIGDHHVTRIDERHALIVAILGVVVAGLVIQIIARAPIETIAFTSAGVAALGVAGIITSLAHWKVSVHTGVGTGVSAVLALALSPWWLLGLVITAAVGWSRVHLGDHTRGQVVVGAVAGALAAGLTYALIA